MSSTSSERDEAMSRRRKSLNFLPAHTHTGQIEFVSLREKQGRKREGGEQRRREEGREEGRF